MKKVLLATLLAFGVSSNAFADTIVDVAAADGSLSTLVTALKAAGLVDTLKGAGPFTVFAPNNAAFKKLPKAKLDALLNDKEALTKILTYHVVAAKITPEDVAAGKVKSVEGHDLAISTSDGVKVNNVPFVGGGDLKADNGEIHIIETVLMPKDAKKSSSKKKSKK
jgi:uncharacterized surface protein with fasciclin (FAS1) repeats